VRRRSGKQTPAVMFGACFPDRRLTQPRAARSAQLDTSNLRGSAAPCLRASAL